MVSVKRVYEPSVPSDGVRVLVERLWPRGMRKESLKMNAWLKDIAPSDTLRRWFNHDPAKWPEFRRRYFAELNRHRDALQPILDAEAHGNVTLLYSAHDTEHNNALVLKDHLAALDVRGERARSTSRRRAT
jgi:uncharacterized protein YeaO (DUF488 family)